jgi:hypothetical protein
MVPTLTDGLLSLAFNWGLVLVAVLGLVELVRRVR